METSLPCFHKFHRRMHLTLIEKTLILIYITSTLILAQEGHCPWTKDLRVPAAIKSRCECHVSSAASNPGPQLSIQCHDVEGSQLVTLLSQRGKVENLQLLYLNASKVTDPNGQVPASFFKDIKIISLQMSGCGIKSVHNEAFRGQQTILKHLSLTNNQLKDIPSSALENLHNLTLLDLSHNRITTIKNNTFNQFHMLTTLKLNDNNLHIHSHAFRGLESSLKNLNLKGTHLSSIPEAIVNLSTLAFLDLAQNRISDLDPRSFSNLNSLTALNFERNLLQIVPTSAFAGINDTLSSLSLLNNLLNKYPTEALQYLHQLRVLDLGFNLLTEIPENAFEGLSKLTLLALDGNPLPTLPLKSFASVNQTLRGLSLGGRFLNCDCRISWIADWIQRFDLQITSRERNPQFCGNPPQFRRFNFYQLKYDDFQCEPNNMTSSMSTITTSFSKGSNAEPAKIDHKRRINASESSEVLQQPVQRKVPSNPIGLIRVRKPKDGRSSTPPPETGSSETESVVALYEDLVEEAESRSSTSKPYIKKIILPTDSSNKLSGTLIRPPPLTAIQDLKSLPKSIVSTTSSTSTIISIPNTKTTTTTVTPKKLTHFQPSPDFDDSKIPVISGMGPRILTAPNTGSVVQVRVTPAPTTSRTLQRSTTTTDEPDLGVNHQNHLRVPTNLVFADPSSDIEIEDIERLGESILVQWESSRQNGFRIIYRLFGEDTFRHGPPLAPSEREYRIQNVPYNECIVICVVPYEEIVYNEISTSASAIPPGSQCRELKPTSHSALMNHMEKITIGASLAICFIVILAILIFIVVTRRAKRNRQDSPIMSKIATGSFSTPSPGPLPVLTSGGSMSKDCDWDQLSGISNRSIPRARVYNMSMDVPTIGNGPSRGVLPLHSHHHHYQSQALTQGQRSGPDSHSTNRTYLSSHHAHYNASYNNNHNHGSSYLNNQSRLLRASLGPRVSQGVTGNKKHNSGHTSRRDMDEDQGKRRKGTKGPRLSTCDSLNTLSGYDTPDNWTDHDMDVYVAQNATRRNLVQL